MKLRILVACEYSGEVRRALRALGHDAWSCDLLPADDGSEFHIQGDVADILDLGWDVLICFPPCTDLAVSGAKHFAAKRADGRQQRSIDFFMSLANAPIDHIAIENPVGIMSTKWRKPDCIIQPYEHGHEATKTTCLWLKNLCPLVPTHTQSVKVRGTSPRVATRFRRGIICHHHRIGGRFGRPRSPASRKPWLHSGPVLLSTTKN